MRRATFASPFSIFWICHFYPRSPCGERLNWLRTAGVEDDISIHALLAESDECTDYHFSGVTEFLSTLSLRRATRSSELASTFSSISIHALLAESDSKALQGHFLFLISIHALLAESDLLKPCKGISYFLFLSTLSLRRATRGRSPVAFNKIISIHALLAESDTILKVYGYGDNKFLSTLSLRRATVTPLK